MASSLDVFVRENEKRRERNEKLDDALLSFSLFSFFLASTGLRRLSNQGAPLFPSPASSLSEAASAKREDEPRLASLPYLQQLKELETFFWSIFNERRWGAEETLLRSTSQASPTPSSRHSNQKMSSSSPSR